MDAEQWMITFARPAWLTALVPVLALGWLLYQKSQRHSGWEQLLPPAMQRELLQSDLADRPRARFWLLIIGWLLAVLALAGPSWSVPAPTASPNQASVIVVLDVTPGMLADDVAPNRLQRAKHKIRDLLRLASDYQIALIAYAGSAHVVVPQTRDQNTLTNLLDALEPSIMPASGHDVGAALKLASEMIAERPASLSRILLITSASEPEQLQALQQYAAELGPQLAILGVGTQAGAPLPLPGGGFMRDQQGRILVPRLDNQALAAIARQHGAAYHSVTPDDVDLQRLVPRFHETAFSADGEQIRLSDQGHWLVLLLLPLAALAGRRGWLGLSLVVSLAPPVAEAAWADLWQRPDQQGAQLVDQKRPLDAADRFEDPRWKAWALYQAEQYEAAADAYAQVISLEPDDATHHFHYGTALAMSGSLELALEAFEQALTRNPDHQGARHNRSRVEDWLEQLRQQERAGASDTGQPDGGEDGEEPSDEPRDADSQPQSDAPASQEPSQPVAGDTPATGQPTPSPAEPAAASALGSPADGSGDDASAQPSAADPVAVARQAEQAQALRQWLEEIPDNPAELLRRKFLYQHLQEQQGIPP